MDVIFRDDHYININYTLNGKELGDKEYTIQEFTIEVYHNLLQSIVDNPGVITFISEYNRGKYVSQTVIRSSNRDNRDELLRGKIYIYELGSVAAQYFQKCMSFNNKTIVKDNAIRLVKDNDKYIPSDNSYEYATSLYTIMISNQSYYSFDNIEDMLYYAQEIPFNKLFAIFREQSLIIDEVKNTLSVDTNGCYVMLTNGLSEKSFDYFMQLFLILKEKNIKTDFTEYIKALDQATELTEEKGEISATKQEDSKACDFFIRFKLKEFKDNSYGRYDYYISNHDRPLQLDITNVIFKASDK